jgi:ornithine carbamoyltransferase
VLYSPGWAPRSNLAQGTLPPSPTVGGWAAPALPLVGLVQGKDFVGVADLDSPRLAAVLERAARLKHDRQIGRPHPLLPGRVVALIFQKPSLRTRVSFEVGMRELGGQALYLAPAEVGLGERESPADVARVLSRMVHGIVARVFCHRDVETLAREATIPVVNGLSDAEHPCQALADLQTMAEHAGEGRGLRDVTVAYVGDGNNVTHSLMLAAPLFGVGMRIATPPEYRPASEITQQAQDRAEQAGTELSLMDDPVAAVKGADFVYTDTWYSMGQEAEAAERRPIFKQYQVNADLLKAAGPKVKVLHCLPAHRGDEIADDVLDGPSSLVYDQAENRLHAQKSLLVELLAHSRGPGRTEE